MDLSKLNLTPREQRTLENMGMDSVEKIAVRWRDELSLGKARGDAVVNRARTLLAYERIKAIDVNDNAVTLTLSDSSRPTVVSVEHVMGAWGDLNREIDSNRLVIFAPASRPCSLCGREPEYACRACQATLCDECRFKHEHDSYQTTGISYLRDVFQRVRTKAEEYDPMPPDRRIEIEDRPSEEIVDIARENGFDGFAEGLLAELYGNQLMKKAITCALFSTPAEPIHVLVVGNPAGGKTLARDIIARRMGNDIELVGANATRAGLVCNLTTGEPGVLSFANGKVVLADEFDKVRDQDVEYCYELLSNGKCSVHSARVHDTIESHFVMIAFANPVNTIFVKEPVQEIGLPPILLSRFAFVIKAEELEMNHRTELIKKKLLGEVAASDFAAYYHRWLLESRKHIPKWVASGAAIDNYVADVDRIIERYMSSPLRRDLRMSDYARRIASAIARANLSDVDDKVLEDAANLMEACVNAWQS